MLTTLAMVAADFTDVPYNVTLPLVKPWALVVYGVSVGFTIGMASWFMAFYTGSWWRRFVQAG